MAAEGILKKYPDDYPDDVIEILKAMSFTDGKSIMLLGSMSLRSQQYAGDYDGFEKVQLHEKSNETALRLLANKMKENVKALGRMKFVYIGDIKAGVIDEWRIVSRDLGLNAKGKVENYSAEHSRSRVDEMLRAKVITEKEAKETLALLKPHLTPSEMFDIKKSVKFHLVRWKVPEVLAGYKILRDGRKYTLEEAFHSPIISKMDVIALVQQNRFTDFSAVYEFYNNGKALNPDKVDINKSLKEDIAYYTLSGNYFKAIKRQFALAKFKDDTAAMKRLTPILNSDLGRIYHILGDVGTLLSLLEETQPPLSLVRYELEQFKSRMSNIYTLPSFIKDEHYIIGVIEAALKAPKKDILKARLEEIQTALEKHLNDGAKKVISK